MQPIILGQTPHKIPQCEDCGRVRLDRAWVRADFVVPDVTGICPSCGEARKLKEKLKWARDSRELLARRRRGYGPAPADEDVFKGFRS